jgi:hypothetical protein
MAPTKQRDGAYEVARRAANVAVVARALATGRWQASPEVLQGLDRATADVAVRAARVAELEDAA